MANYMVLIDGMTDEPVPILGGKTPLEYADCCVMQQLKQSGSHGLFITCPPGYVAESMTCIMTLLGLEPQCLPKGRAYLEAMAYDLPVAQDDLILRCNLVSVKNDIVVSSSANGLDSNQMKQGAMLAQQCCSFLGLQLLHMQDYKNLLFMKGGKTAERMLQTVAPHENLNQPWNYFLPKGSKLATVLAEFVVQSKELLKKEFRNTGYEYMMIPWGASYYQPAPTFWQLFQSKGSVICGTEIVRGIGKVMGMIVEPSVNATADVDTDLQAKAKTALACSHQYDMVFIHVNGADEAGHRRNAKEKAAFLQRVDQELLQVLKANLRRGDRVLICSDHGTSSVTGKHLDHPQPFILYEEGETIQREYGTVNGMYAVPLLLGRYRLENKRQEDTAW